MERHRDEVDTLRDTVADLEAEARSRHRERARVDTELHELKQLEREQGDALREAQGRIAGLEADKAGHREALRRVQEERNLERDQASMALEAAKADAHDRLAVLEIQLREKTERCEVVASSLEAQEELVRELDARIEKHRDEREEAERRAETCQEEASKKDEMLQFVEKEVQSVKDLFEDKTREAERRAEIAIEEKSQEVLAAGAKVAEAKQETAQLTERLFRAQAAEKAALEAAAAATAKVDDTETEMRTILTMMEQKKLAADANMRQLQEALAELQRTGGLNPSPFR